jgi:hypothetical protein
MSSVSHDLLGLLRMTARGNKCHIFTVNVPPAFKPAQPSDVPTDFSFPQLFIRCSQDQAGAIVKKMNEKDLASGMADHKWTICLFRFRNRKPKAAIVEGGAVI